MFGLGLCSAGIAAVRLIPSSRMNFIDRLMIEYKDFLSSWSLIIIIVIIIIIIIINRETRVRAQGLLQCLLSIKAWC